MAASAFLWYKMDLLQRLQQCWFSNVKIKMVEDEGKHREAEES